MSGRVEQRDPLLQAGREERAQSASESEPGSDRSEGGSSSDEEGASDDGQQLVHPLSDRPTRDRRPTGKWDE